MEIYHGSNIQITRPLIDKGRRNLDFGKGFYTTRIKSQAQKWAFLVASRKSREPLGIVSIFELDEKCLTSGNYIFKEFPSYNEEWLEFVIACRQGKDTTNYDIIEGGVANDQVIDTVEDYENGRITAEQALDQLKYKKPNNQICIRSQQVIDLYMHFIGIETVTDNDVRL